jgi:hypothetical protein
MYSVSEQTPTEGDWHHASRPGCAGIAAYSTFVNLPPSTGGFLPCGEGSDCALQGSQGGQATAAPAPAKKEEEEEKKEESNFKAFQGKGNSLK